MPLTHELVSEDCCRFCGIPQKDSRFCDITCQRMYDAGIEDIERPHQDKGGWYLSEGHRKTCCEEVKRFAFRYHKAPRVTFPE